MGHIENSHEKVSQSIILLRIQVCAHTCRHTCTYTHTWTQSFIVLLLISVSYQETAKLSDHHKQEVTCCDLVIVLEVMHIFILFF